MINRKVTARLLEFDEAFEHSKQIDPIRPCQPEAIFGEYAQELPENYPDRSSNHLYEKATDCLKADPGKGNAELLGSRHDNKSALRTHVPAIRKSLENYFCNPFHSGDQIHPGGMCFLPDAGIAMLAVDQFKCPNPEDLQDPILK